MINMTEAEAIIGKRYSLIIPKKIREKILLKEGQLVKVRAGEGVIVIEPYPADPFKVLEEALGDFVYDKAARKEAERWLIAQAKRGSEGVT